MAYDASDDFFERGSSSSSSSKKTFSEAGFAGHGTSASKRRMLLPGFDSTEGFNLDFTRPTDLMITADQTQHADVLNNLTADQRSALSMQTAIPASGKYEKLPTLEPDKGISAASYSAFDQFRRTAAQAPMALTDLLRSFTREGGGAGDPRNLTVDEKSRILAAILNFIEGKDEKSPFNDRIAREAVAREARALENPFYQFAVNVTAAVGLDDIGVESLTDSSIYKLLFDRIRSTAQQQVSEVTIVAKRYKEIKELSDAVTKQRLDIQRSFVQIYANYLPPTEPSPTLRNWQGIADALEGDEYTLVETVNYYIIRYLARSGLLMTSGNINRTRIAGADVIQRFLVDNLATIKSFMQTPSIGVFYQQLPSDVPRPVIAGAREETADADRVLIDAIFTQRLASESNKFSYEFPRDIDTKDTVTKWIADETQALADNNYTAFQLQSVIAFGASSLGTFGKIVGQSQVDSRYRDIASVYQGRVGLSEFTVHDPNTGVSQLIQFNGKSYQIVHLDAYYPYGTFTPQSTDGILTEETFLSAQASRESANLFAIAYTSDTNLRNVTNTFINTHTKLIDTVANADNWLRLQLDFPATVTATVRNLYLSRVTDGKATPEQLAPLAKIAELSTDKVFLVDFAYNLAILADELLLNAANVDHPLGASSFFGTDILDEAIKRDLEAIRNMWRVVRLIIRRRLYLTIDLRLAFTAMAILYSIVVFTYRFFTNWLLVPFNDLERRHVSALLELESSPEYQRQLTLLRDPIYDISELSRRLVPEVLGHFRLNARANLGISQASQLICMISRPFYQEFDPTAFIKNAAKEAPELVYPFAELVAISIRTNEQANRQSAIDPRSIELSNMRMKNAIVAFTNFARQASRSRKNNISFVKPPKLLL